MDMQEEKVCETQCVGVAMLRKKYGADMNLERWCENSNNILCCRRGRVFIHEKDPQGAKVKHVFTYPQSKWHNPFKVEDNKTVADVCALFEKHILGSELRNHLDELVGKTLGCFCAPSSQCHIRTLQRLVQMRDDLPPSQEVLTNKPKQ